MSQCGPSKMTKIRKWRKFKNVKMQELMERPERRRREGQCSVRFAFGRRSSLFCVTVLFLYLCLLWLYVFYGFCVGPAKLQCGATPASVTMAWFTQFWQFGAILSPSGVLRWQCRNGKMVPNHQPGCPQPWSNLDPPWSSHLGSPGPTMAQFTQFMAIWGYFWP